MGIGFFHSAGWVFIGEAIPGMSLPRKTYTETSLQVGRWLMDDLPVQL